MKDIEKNLDEKWEKFRNMSKEEFMEFRSMWKEYKKLTKVGFLLCFSGGFFISFVLFGSGLVFP